MSKSDPHFIPGFALYITNLRI